MFDCEHVTSLHTMQDNQASSRSEGEVSWFFVELQREPGVYSQVVAGMILESSCLFSDFRTPL